MKQNYLNTNPQPRQFTFWVIVSGQIVDTITVSITFDDPNMEPLERIRIAEKKAIEVAREMGYMTTFNFSLNFKN